MFEWILTATCMCLWHSGLNTTINKPQCLLADGLMALAGLSSIPGLKGNFSAPLGYRACYEIKFLDRHRGFACVLIKL